MKVYAISDPHLSFGVPGKSMDRFGAVWVNHVARLQKNWDALVTPQDIVVVPGDISWAKRLAEAIPDLDWLHARPGRKVILKGNHDVWWPTSHQLEQVLPSSIHFVHNNCVRLGSCAFFGSRLWDTDEYSVFDLIEWDPVKGEIPGVKSEGDLNLQRKLYERELARLQLSLNHVPDGPEVMRIGLTHYPPIDHELGGSRAAEMFKAAKTQHVIFGHLHSVKNEWLGRAFGKWEGLHFHLTSCDYLNMMPKLICEIA